MGGGRCLVALESLNSAAVRTSTAREMSSALESSSGEWLTPPLRLRTKSIPVGTPASARTAASCPAPDGSSTTGRPRSSSSACERRAGAVGERHGIEREVGLELERAGQAGEALGVGRTCVDGERDAVGDHVDGAGLDLKLPDRRDGAVDPVGDLAHVEDVLGGGDERIGSARHRDGAGVPGHALERARAAHHADDPRDDAERRAARWRGRGLARCAARGSRPAAAWLLTKAVLPVQPRSSSRKATTAPVPARSTASIPATTPRAPSNLPPLGTESRCEPVQTRGSSLRPIEVPVRRRRRRRARPRASSWPRARGRGPPPSTRRHDSRRGADGVELLEPFQHAHARIIPRRGPARLWTKSHTFGTNSMSREDSSDRPGRDLSGDSPL